MEEFDFFSPQTRIALDYILKNWNPEKESMNEFRDRIFKITNNQPDSSKREDTEVFCPIDGRVLDNEKPFHKNQRFCCDCGEYRDGI